MGVKNWGDRGKKAKRGKERRVKEGGEDSSLHAHILIGHVGPSCVLGVDRAAMP